MHRNLLVLFLACLLAACVPGPPAGPPAPPKESGAWLTILDYPDDDRDVERRLAALKLGVHRVEAAREALIRHLQNDRDPRVREIAAYALGRIGGPAAAEALLAARFDSSVEVRLAVVDALAAQLDDRVAPALAEMAKQNDERVSLAVARALAEAGRLDESWEITAPREAVFDEKLSETSVYVDPSAGTDEGDGSAQKPFRTIQRGLAVLSPGGTLWVAGIKDQPIREAVVIPADLSGDPRRPTRLMAWPGRPRPVLSPTKPLAAAAWQKQADGRWRAGAERPVFGVFLPAAPDQVEIVAAVANPGELKPNTCWWDAEKKEVVLDLGSAPLPKTIELAFAEDALAVNGAHDVLIQGIDVRFAPDSGFDAAGARRVSFLDCRAEYCDRHGFFFYYSPGGLISGCRAERCRFQGVSVRSSPQTVVLDSAAADNGIDGFLFLYDSDDCLAARATATGNFRGISFIEGSDYGRVVGGDFTGNRQGTISFESGSIGGQVVPLP